MCGFTGFIDYKKESSIDILRKMSDTIFHRGPDDEGCEIIENGNCSIGFGFRRLSIIDLSPSGHQPKFSEDKRVAVMLNGEIYNYAEIKSELIELGYSFDSKSDTEVVLKAYLQWGTDMLHRFIGMFSIVICDQKTNQLYLIRDRVGNKPLFWYQYNEGVLFGSELKSFHQNSNFKKELNLDALSLFFMNGSIPAPYSIFKNTYKVKPGNFLKVDLTTKETTSIEYWNAFDAYNLPTLNISYVEAKNELEKLMVSAFNYRMVSDVPVGVFLSGGYDSTAVAAILSKGQSVINTYTIGFDNEKYNEAEYAKQVAKHLGTNHNEYYCSYSDALQIIPDLPEIYDEPFGDPSAIPTTLVSRIARKYVKVALSADAGDELFAGYPRHKKSLELINKLNALPDFSKSAITNVADLMHFLLERNISKPSKFDKLSLTSKSNETLEVFNIINQTYTQNEVKRLISDDFKVPNTIYNEDDLLRSDLSVLNRILACEYRTYLTDDILQKVDRATMYNSLEGREPFLDHRLLEFVARIPESYKYNDGKSKIILKDIVHDYVPKSIMERPKMGFGVPIENWLKSELKDLYEEVLDLDKIKNQGVLNVDTIAQLKRGFINDEVKDIYRLWFVFVFQLWYDRWMN